MSRPADARADASGPSGAAEQIQAKRALAKRRQPRAAADAPIGAEEARRLLLPAIAGARRALLAVSGGPDSVALMRLCAAIAREGGLGELHVATVDHGLRADSRAEAERVGAWARDCGLAHSILSWQGPKPATRIQERARSARYALLGAKAREIGAEILVTAHTLDDQAETVLMRIAHGSGLAGLAAMRFSSMREGLTHARPFLAVAKARLLSTCRANHWPFSEDPANADPRFARARWRKLAPALAKEGLTAARLAKLALRAASAEEALEAKADEAFGSACIERRPDGLVLDIAGLVRREPREITLRVLLRALAELRGAERHVPVRLERVENVLDGLRTCVAERRVCKRTVAGAIIAFDGVRTLSCGREKRRRGLARGAAAAGFASSAEAPASPRTNQGNSNASLVLV
ncbi:MAG: tRNA lysidine(34) synthetase TilS [Hyphomicrobiales bacterium]